MTCTHRLFDGPLVCVRADDHQPGHGCTYDRGDTDDRHTEGADDQ